jgi:hypothetical protein
MISIKILLDVSTMYVADLTEWLMEAEEAFEEAPTSLQQDEKLYLTEEEWDMWRKMREVEKHSSSGGASKGHRCGWGHGRSDSSSGGSSNKPTDNECQRCGKMGHWAHECRSRPRKERDVGTWNLDIGATKHMSGCRAVFTKLDTAVLSTVCFGDDSVAQINSREVVMFVCTNGESRSLKGVYFIPRLATNIMSIGQLDEVSYKIDIDTSMMKIWEHRVLLLARVKCEVTARTFSTLRSCRYHASQCMSGMMRWCGVGMSASRMSTWRPFRIWLRRN